jgi:hypothetical protein
MDNRLSPRLPSIISNNQRLIFLFIIVGVIFLGFVIGLFLTEQRTLKIFVVLAGIAAVFILLQKPALGFFMIIFSGMLIPFSGPSGLNGAILGVFLLFGVWVVRMLVFDRRIVLARSRTMAPIIVFFLLSLISFGLGQFTYMNFAQTAPLDAQIGGLLIFLASAGVFLLTANLIKDLRWLEWLTWLFIAIGGIYVFGRFLGIGYIFDRFYHIGLTAGSMFWTWLAALTFGQAFMNRKIHPFVRIALGSITLVGLYVGYFQAGDWKSGWMPPLFAVFAIIGLRYWKIAIILAPLAFMGVNFLSNQALSTEAYSWGTRIDAWLIVLEITKASPIFGLGFSNYFWYTSLFPIRGWKISFNSHSQYVDLIAQTGVLGLACFFWLFGELAWLGWKLRNRAPQGFTQAYVYGAMGGLVGTLVAGWLVDWILPFVYNIGLTGFRASVLAWIFLGGLVSIEQSLLRQEAN